MPVDQDDLVSKHNRVNRDGADFDGCTHRVTLHHQRAPRPTAANMPTTRRPGRIYIRPGAARQNARPGDAPPAGAARSDARPGDALHTGAAPCDARPGDALHTGAARYA